MFELPEMVTLSRQMRQALAGKRVQRGDLGNSPHKFVWYNRKPDEFNSLVTGKLVGDALSRGRWLFLPLEPGYVLVFGECGGKILHHPSGSKLPAKYHLGLWLDDGSFLTAATQMWGAMELFEQGRELERQYIRGMRPTPTAPEFTFDYFCNLIEEASAAEKRSAKGLLTQEQLIPGLGNSIAQDILFHARLHPKRSIAELDLDERRALFDAVQSTVQEVIAQGGRSDEFDLYGCPGGYTRRMDKNAAGQPCPVCGTPIAAIQYLGGSCYFCPSCQK